MLKIYDERNLGRTTILIHVLITAFCQGVLIALLFNQVVGFNEDNFAESYGGLSSSVSLISSRFICTVMLHL